MQWVHQRLQAIDKVLTKDIWKPAALHDSSIKGRFFAVIRVLSISWTGLFENAITSRAAALSYSSLLGLGPLVALIVLVTGMMMDPKDPHVAVNSINRLVSFVAPQVVAYNKLQQQPAAAQTESQPSQTGSQTEIKPELVQLIDNFISGSRSGTAGVLGVLMLILIVIQLFTSVENAFNSIWGVRRGRSWLTRIVFYWTLVTLGAVLFFASLTALGAAAFINVFVEKLPYGTELLSMLKWMLPAFSVGILVLILTIFYRYIPNTRVIWRAAIIGAIIVTALLFLNNYLAFLYFRQVVSQKSLYGSLGILPVLMVGLYIFWFFVLLGGQIAYAVQNVHFRSSQIAWHNLSEATRESLSLLVLLMISRRFRECLAPYSASQLGERTKTPTQILNESLNRLTDLQLITAIPPAEGQSALDYRYQPARPLDKITLSDFRRLFTTKGENPSGESLDAIDPILVHYHERIDAHIANTIGSANLAELLERFPLPQEED